MPDPDPRVETLYAALLSNVAQACPAVDMEELKRAVAALTGTLIDTFTAMGPDNVPYVAVACAYLGGQILGEVMARHEAAAASVH